MNAGAFSSETMDKVLYIDVLTGGKVKRLWKGGINYGYRRTDIQGIILGGAIALEPSSPDAVRQKTREYLEKRRQTQPAGKSAGSVFKKRAEWVPANIWTLRDLRANASAAPSSAKNMRVSF